MEQKKWWETAEPMISAVQCNFGENSYDILRRHTVGRGFNTEQLYHLTASGSMSYYNEEKDGAALDEYLKEAHKCGIREIQYINVHCIRRRSMKSIRTGCSWTKTAMKSWLTMYIIIYA